MESKKHHDLVKGIYDYVCGLNNIDCSLIESDIFDIVGKITRMPDGFVPDLYYKYNCNLVIGEAKTEFDLEREHSIQQFKSYYEYLKKYSSLGFDCLFIISVPWNLSVSASRIIKRIFVNNDITFIVMNEMGVYKIYEKNKIE